MTRHSWEQHDDGNVACRTCSVTKRPHPYARFIWLTEWRLPNGEYANNLHGRAIPPCAPPGLKEV